MEKSSVRQILFSSLRFAILGAPFSDEVKGAVAKTDWSQLLACAKGQKIAHLVGFALKENALLPEDKTLAAAFEKEIMMAVLLTERIEREREKACMILEEAGIDHIPLKGALLRRFYPETWMRTSADADILIPEKDLDKASRVLQEERGYRCLGRGSHDLSFLAPGGVNIELHFALVEKDRLPEAAALLGRVWEFAKPVAQKKQEKELPDELFLFYHLVHMAKHLNNGGVGIRFFVDLYLIDQKMNPDQEALSRMLSDGKLSEFYRVCKNLAKAWMEETEKLPQAELLEEFVFSGGVFGTWENYVAVRRGRKGKWSYFFARIFPSYHTMAARYPVLKKWRCLLAFYYLRRFFEHFFAGRGSVSLYEWQKNQNLDEENISRMTRLLKALDLHFHD